MNKLFLVILFFISLATSAQDKLDKVTISFYPSFEPASTLTINFKKSKILFSIDETKQTNRFELSAEENDKLKSVINNLLNNTRLPIETLKSKDGGMILLDGKLTEDGMAKIIYVNGKKGPAIQFGNSYSKSETELLAKLTNLIRTKTISNEYINKLENYLN